MKIRSETSNYVQHRTILNVFSLLYFLFLACFLFLFIFGCVHAGFLQLQRAGATLCCSVRASHCGGFSCCRAWALATRASVVVARRLHQLWLAGFISCGSWALERRLSSCGARAQLLRGMWDLPGPGLKLVSPALTGGFSATAPPGKPLYFHITYSKLFSSSKISQTNTIH